MKRAGLWTLLAALALVGLRGVYGNEPPTALGPDTLRVRIIHSHRAITLGCSGDYQVALLGGGKAVAFRGPQSARASFGHSLIVGHKSFHGKLLVSPLQPGHFLSVNGRHYRGVLLLEAVSGGNFEAINQLALEEYLYGVLPKEVGTDWPPEALQAQAVVSRTYALANRTVGPGQRYDVSSDVYSQVYGGKDSEAPSAVQAVEATRGEILTGDDGKPIEAFFHSSCGGRTETPDQVWSKHPASDVFTSVGDDFCKEDPFYRWTVKFSGATLRARLRRAGLRVGDIQKIRAAKKSSSGRVAVFALETSRGTFSIPGNRFRMALGPESLRSTLLTDISRAGDGFRFDGRGWGHGVGLCQWGAKGRAAAGQTHAQILGVYYAHAKLVRLVWNAS